MQSLVQTPFETVSNRKFLLHGLCAIALLVMTWLVLSHAWFSDDAYFSFRTIDNFVNGYGLTWNVAERVQAYTHPLWVLLLSPLYALTGEIYLTAIFTSLALTLAVVAIVHFGMGRGGWQGLGAIFLLCLSTAFIDYSSSGLENPLTHLLLAAFLLVYFRQERSTRKLFWLSLLAALSAVNRLDTVLFYVPALLYMWWQVEDKWRGASAAALGFLPLVAWEAFSIIYYGFPFPNTYYAKVNNYVPFEEAFWTGLDYLAFTAKFDPITWVVILAAIGVVVWRKEKRGVAIALGIALYLLYVVQVGGDFMGGRFFSAAYLAAVVLLLVYLFPKLKPTKHWPLVLLAFITSLLAASPPYFLYPRDFQKTRWPAITNVDERMEYYSTNFLRIEDFYAFNSNSEYNLLNKVAYLVRSLYRGTAFRTNLEHDWYELGEELREHAQREGKLYPSKGANGFTGFAAGPDVHIIQRLALTDGFLSRLPPLYYADWRSGHFQRLIPDGYLEAERGDITHLPDPALDAYYQKIKLVTHGELFTRERWQEIWELNTRNFDELLPGYEESFRFPDMTYIEADELIESGAPVSFNGARGIGLQIEFSPVSYATSMEIGLSGGDDFTIYYLDSVGNILASHKLISESEGDFETYHLEIPARARETGVAALRVLPGRIRHGLTDEEFAIQFLKWQD